jgi:hypothetical protein
MVEENIERKLLIVLKYGRLCVWEKGRKRTEKTENNLIGTITGEWNA